MNEDQLWAELYSRCSSTQMAFLAAECRIKKGMSYDETVKWLLEECNFELIDMSEGDTDE